MLTKQNRFDFSKYKEVQFVIGKSDTWSLTKIKDFMGRGGVDITKDVHNLKIIKLFRSREVKQSYLTSVATTLYALLHSVYVIAANRPDIVSLDYLNLLSCSIGDHQRARYSGPSLLRPLRPLKAAPLEYQGQDPLHRELLPSNLPFALRPPTVPHRG